ncbi:peptidoglycan recognition protein family protein [Enemella evansiae]|uniref:N-acetylmuramoyl-L-alanine amidase n=1 Tax=Enemella evansiae TaxID=2016499 RepID=A0A255FW53_9ACTN|nr:peptidoglycan recognition family protein [Enemella evansiae]OYO05868.1 N-acetylmuramoyl-L-alanine amidase [Enemella evansiae]OYO07895.1 N-acetylmuramoyl-L-alanine amidase [Enemella evansiae]TDO92509.1 N-acetylmuramoyl-L-alanine amidase [Enemella evansiae]
MDPYPSTGQRRVSRRALLGGGAAAGAAALGLGGYALFRDDGTPQPLVGAPRVAGTDDWGARSPDRSLRTLSYRPTYLVVHHTDTANTRDTSRNQAYSLARSIQNWHMQQGWGDSGQHFTVSRGGVVLEGRHGSLAAAQGGRRFVQGVHAPGSNRTGIGIETEGDYVSQLPPTAQRQALVQLLAWLCGQYRIPVSRIIGHRDSQGSNTDCPGARFHADLPRLRTEVTAFQRANS